jgi:hypothetical protein
LNYFFAQGYELGVYNIVRMREMEDEKKTFYVADIETKEIHNGHCSKVSEDAKGVNTLVLEERNDAEIFLDKLGFEECDHCQPHILKLE